MSETQKDFTKTAQDLLSRTLTRQVRAAQRYYDLLARYGRGELSTREMTEEYARFASQETGRYARDLADISIQYFGDLLALNQEYSERFLNFLDQKSPQDITNPPGATTPRRVEMEIRAPLGHEAVRAFVLENKRGDSAEISFLVADFSGPTGTQPFQPEIAFQPEQFTLEPGQEQTVTLRIPLREGTYEAGQRYRAVVIVRGYDDLELALTILVDEKG